MLALRSVPRRASYFLRVRGNVTVSVTPSDTTAPVPPPPAPKATATPSTKTTPGASSTPDIEAAASEEASSSDAPKKHRKYDTKRPRIDLEHPRQWSRPIGIGKLPAYDEALAYIKRDSAALKAELKTVQTRLAEAEKSGNAEEVAALKEKEDILEIQSEINLPSVRWKARNGMADMSKKVYRHLVEQRWREDGALDLLMERIYQMKVVPDLLPALHPTIDLRVNYPEKPPESVYLRTRVKRKYEQVEPGIFLLPEQTRKAPMVYTTVFHTDTRLYTMLMVDLDVPDPENESFQTYLHWMQPNIALSATSAGEIPLTTAHTPYIPPHPQQGTRYHRYVILMLPQPSATERIKVPVLTEADRLGFDFRAFAQRYGFDGVTGGGAHMFREVWDPTVSHIYEHVLKTEEPKFGAPPRVDPYAAAKRAKKYLLG